MSKTLQLSTHQQQQYQIKLNLEHSNSHRQQQTQQNTINKIWQKEDFEFGPSLGKGKFSEVFLAREKLSGYIVALKVMDKKFLKSYDLEEQLKREILLQNSCQHDNILQIFGFFYDQDNIYLILEYAEQGDLYSLMHNQINQRLDEKQAAYYLKQVIKALIFLHSKNIIHRDLKPENILLSKGEVKLGDFGLAIQSDSNSKEKRKTFCGTLDYISPEMFIRKGHDYKIDIWSIGVLTYELCAGLPPFESQTYNETMQKVCKCDIQYPDHFSVLLRDLLQKILHKDPEQRLQFNEILQHQWFIINLQKQQNDY